MLLMYSFSCQQMHFFTYLARALSFFSAMTTTWLINRTITFSVSDQLSIHHEFIRYFLTSLIGGAVNLLIYLLLIYSFSPPALILPLVVAIGSLAGMILNYLLAKQLIYFQAK